MVDSVEDIALVDASLTRGGAAMGAVSDAHDALKAGLGLPVGFPVKGTALSGRSLCDGPGCRFFSSD